MLKKTVTYTDFDGNIVSENCYFNLSTVELIDLDSKYPNGFENMAKTFMDSNDGGAIMKVVKDIILMAYGEKSEDGRRFIKTPDLRRDFEQSLAFTKLFDEMIIEPDKFIDFVNSITPNVHNRQGAAAAMLSA